MENNENLKNKKQELKFIKKQINQLKPQFNIGKNQITTNLIDIILKYLKANKIVKIKSTNAKNKQELNEFASQISLKTSSKILEIKGFTFTLYLEE